MAVRRGGSHKDLPATLEDAWRLLSEVETDCERAKPRTVEEAVAALTHLEEEVRAHRARNDPWLGLTERRLALARDDLAALREGREPRDDVIAFTLRLTFEQGGRLMEVQMRHDLLASWERETSEARERECRKTR